ncbi:MAG: 50S ribosomal protein L11 methyltransferase [Oscillospiraceae bacterium]|nr:50S ribosomal protein L11 methyltransferase [Oscillospiraceae bacterium]
MDWTELTLRVPTELTDTAAAIAHMAVPYGLYIEDYSDLEQGAAEIAHIDLIDEDLLAKDRTQSILHLYLPPHESPAEALSWLRERFSESCIPFAATSAEVCNADWENNWKQYFHALPVGQRLLIQPTWEPLRNPENRLPILMEPGLAFGSGSHATTRLCLEALEAAMLAGSRAPRVLDIGCGSGILGIAAALLGAGEVTAIDIDPLAIHSTIENCKRNRIPPEKLQPLCGNLTEKAAGQYSIILSNIVADAICSLTETVGELLAPGGVWICSGIIDTREPDVLTALESRSFRVQQRLEEGGWVCLSCIAHNT